MTANYEQEIARKEGIINHLSDEYFKARPQLDNGHNRRIFESGADRMYWILSNKEDKK